MKKLFYCVACFVGLTVLSFGALNSEEAYAVGNKASNTYDVESLSIQRASGGMIAWNGPYAKTVVSHYGSHASIPSSISYTEYNKNKWRKGKLNLISSYKSGKNWVATFRGVMF